ncbi:MAG: hypothetical protein IPH09_05280 [bacterium]|nr:hypothetical protein [bacterium]
MIGAGDAAHVGRFGADTPEHNLGAEPCHLYRSWISPERRGLTPSYDQRTFDPDDWRNRLHAVASGRGDAGAVTLNADAVIHRCDLEAGRVRHARGRRRQAEIRVREGGAPAGRRQELDANDQARIEARGPGHRGARARNFVLIEVPA